MKQIILLFAFSFFVFSIQAQTRNSKFSATGEYSKKKENEIPTTGTGLEKVYVFKSLSGSTVSYTTAKSNSVNIYTYETDYINNATPVPPSLITTTPIGASETMYTVSGLQDSKGLVFDDNNQAKAVWIIDYTLHRPKLIEIAPIESEDKCKTLKLGIGKSDILVYRGTSGQSREVDRKYNISYNILNWEEDRFVSSTHEMTDVRIGTEIVLDRVPNKDTQFTLSGDQYGKEFGMPGKFISNMYQAIAVEAKIKTFRHGQNTENDDKQELGGSAPVEIDFFGYANEPTANHFSWYIFNKKDTKNPIARYNDREMSYTFSQAGDYIARFEAGNTSSACLDSVSVSLNISESDLDAPNFFTPRSTTGQNTVFKFTYKSIIKFKCTIFNRWGNKVYEWTDPSQGWDGRYKGSLVNPGVYYYVVEAVGSEGKRYKEASDLNIL